MTHTRESALARIEELAALAPGWLDGGGDSLPQEVAERGKELVAVTPESLLAHYGIFPTEEGNLTFEFPSFNGNVFYDVLVDRTGLRVSRLSFGDACEDEELRFTNPVDAAHVLEEWFRELPSSNKV